MHQVPNQTLFRGRVVVLLLLKEIWEHPNLILTTPENPPKGESPKIFGALFNFWLRPALCSWKIDKASAESTTINGNNPVQFWYSTILVQWSSYISKEIQTVTSRKKRTIQNDYSSK